MAGSMPQAPAGDQADAGSSSATLPRGSTGHAAAISTGSSPASRGRRPAEDRAPLGTLDDLSKPAGQAPGRGLLETGESFGLS
jgi:hypothetical protein